MTRSAPAILALLAVTAVSCGTSTPAPQPSAAATTSRTVAQEFVDGYYHQFPEEAYEVGYPDTPMDRLGDRSQAAMATWRAREVLGAGAERVVRHATGVPGSIPDTWVTNHSGGVRTVAAIEAIPA